MDYNFKLKDTRYIDETKSDCFLYEHKSGAGLVYLKNNDENKVFSVTFRTPPYDSTGLPHILEHSVLGGSKKFPVKEPFNELIKGSLYTYLNAMTYLDKTVYPVASCNDKDFMNLMEVYLDSVFNPLIYDRKETFLQEGWSYKIEDKNDSIKYNGIVFNEMKGAYSDPFTALDGINMQSLFPDTVYRHDSGGNPENITDLTYEDFTSFHKNFYHPANSYIYIYGDVDIDRCLKLLDEEYLCKYIKEDFVLSTKIPIQKPFTEPVFAKVSYSVTPDTSLEEKNMVAASVVINRSEEQWLSYGLSLLSYILIETPASPLRKILEDMDLGEEVDSNSDFSLNQMIFSVSIKNTKYTNHDFKTIFYDALNKVLADGIDKELIKATLAKYEFIYREDDYGSTPKGLMYNLSILNDWLYDYPPFGRVQKIKALEYIKAEAEKGGYFDHLLNDYILNNNHAAFVMIEPEIGFDDEKAKTTEEKLNKYKESLSDNELNTLINQTKMLAEYQERKDTEENLMKVPFVELSDISKKAEFYDVKDISGDVKRYYSEFDTNGILYSNFVFSTERVPIDKLPVISILSTLLTKISTKNYSYADLSNEINIKLGGIGISFDMVNRIGKMPFPCIVIKTKNLKQNNKALFDIINELIHNTLFDDDKRIKDILKDNKSKLENQYLNSGHSVSMLRANSYYSYSGQYKEAVYGTQFYLYFNELMQNYNTRIDDLKRDLYEISKLIFNKESFIQGITCDKDMLVDFDVYSGDFYNGLQSIKNEIITHDFMYEKKNEAFVTSGKVQYNTMSADFHKLGYQYNGKLYLMSNIISNTYFMDEIRIKGGAYGFGANFNQNGIMNFYSYRDPNLRNTFEVYRKTGEFISTLELSENEMKKSILGTINRYDRPKQPKDKGEFAFTGAIMGKTLEMCQSERDEILSASPSDFKQYAEIIEACTSENNICTVGSEDKIIGDSDLFGTVVHLSI